MSSNDASPRTPVTYQEAMSALPELPEAWRAAVYREAAKIGLTESDPLWWFLVAHTTLLKTFLDGLPVSNGNGSAPGQDLKMSQLSDLIKRTDALALSIKSLPRQDPAVSRQDIEKLVHKATENPELSAFLEDWRITKAEQHNPHRRGSRWLRQAGAVALITAMVFGAGWLGCWLNLHKDVEARIDRIIDAQPTAYRVPAYLAAHRGSIALAPLKPAEGHNETQGIVISPGDLKLGSTWVSTEGATVIPLQ